MSEFLAQAEIVVRANTKPFLADFEKAVKIVESTKVEVTLRATMKGFRVDLDEKLARSTKNLVVRPLVRADMKGFRIDLEEKVRRASKGVSATVAVKAGAVKGAAASAGAGAAGVTTSGVVDRRAAAAQLAVNAAVASGVASRRRITAAISNEEKFTTRLEREQLHLKASVEAVNKAIIAGVPELLALAEAEERAARGALELSAAQETRRSLGVPVGVSTSDFQAQIAEQNRLRTAEEQAVAAGDAARLAADAKIVNQQKEITKLLALDARATDAAAAKFVKDEAARITAIEAETKALAKRGAAAVVAARKADTARQLGSGSNLTRTEDAAGNIIPGGGAAIGADAIARNEAVTVSTKAVAKVKADLAHAERIEAAAARVAGDTDKQLVASRGALRITTTAVVEAELALEAALASQSIATIEAAAAQLTLAKDQEKTLITTNRQVEADHKRIRSLGDVKRALIAQAAAATGLRAAALTAATPFIIASAGFLALRKAVGLAAKLQTELSVFKVTSGATAEQMTAVSEKAIQLGKDITLPGVSANDAAVALTELSKAGLSVQDSVDGAQGVLQLATAANIDFTQATNLAASALNAFGLRGSEAGHVADVLANSANLSQGSITDVGVALQQSSAVIRQAGISLEQGVGALTLFARAGLRGSDAGTSLRTALIRLINPSKKAEEVIARLGLRIRDAQGNIDLHVFQQFADATKQLGAAERDKDLAIIFGQDAIRGAAILQREGARGLDAMTTAVNKAGTAQEVASARTSGYAGSIENLKNQLESVGESIGTAFLPPFTAVVNLFSGAVQGVDALTGSLVRLGNQLNKPFDAALGALGQSTKPPVDELGAQVPIEKLSDKEFFFKTVKDLFFSADLKQKFIDLGEEIDRTKDKWVSFRGQLADKTGIEGLGLSLDSAKEKIKEISDEIDRANAKRSGLDPGEHGQRPGGVGTARDALDSLGGLSVTGDPEKVNASVIALQKLQAQLENGTRAEKEAASALGAYITQIQELSAQSGKLPKLEIPLELTNPKDQFQRLLDVIQTGTPAAVKASLKELTSLQKQLAAGTPSQQKAADSIGKYVEHVKELSKNPAKISKIEVPPDIAFDLLVEFKRMSEEAQKDLEDKLGKGWHDAGLDGNTAFWGAFQAALEPQANALGARAHDIFLQGFDPAGLGDETSGVFMNTFLENLNIGRVKAAKEAGAGFVSGSRKAEADRLRKTKTATTKADNQVLGTERAQTDAQIAGNVNAELAALRTRERVIKRAITRLNAADQTGDLPIAGTLKQRSKFKTQLAATISEREQLEESIASDAKKAADDLKKKRDAADEAFLASLEVGRTPFNRRLARAEQTTGESDNVTALQAFGKRLLHERDAVRKGVKDAKTKTKELQRLSDELFQNGLDIAAAKKTRDEAAKTALGEKGEALQSLGETTGSTRLIIQGLDILIAQAKVVLAKAIVAKTGQLAAKAALEVLKKTRRDTIQSAKDALLGAAFDLAEARDNKSQMLQILDVQIESAKKEVAAAKTLLDRLVAQAKVQNLINKKKEIIAEEAKKADDKQGITVFDLLKQNVDVFNKSAGNLIGPNQPFAGAFGFTADIAQFLTRRGGATGAGGAGATGKGGINPFEKPLFSGGTFASRGKDLTSQLIDALQELTRTTKESVGESKKATSSGGRSPLTDKALTSFKQQFVVGKPKGLVESGNIDVLHRPNVPTPGMPGFTSSVRSITVGIQNGMAAVIPTVLGKGKNARVVSDDEAKRHFRETGENLGIFSSEKAAQVYADALHKQQAKLGTQRSEQGVVSSSDRIVEALDRNTAALLGTSGNGSTADANPKTSTPNNPWGGRRWFGAAGTAKAAEEA